MRNLRAILGGGLVAVVLSSTASPAHAAGEVATRVSIAPLEALTVGSEASLVVTLAQETGAAVVDEPIALTIDGDSRPRRWTDADGVATFNLPRDLLPGAHEVVATYSGRPNAYLVATAQMVVEIIPYELAIETVPPLPGMLFEIDGTRFAAAADGVARVGLDRLGDYALTALPAAYRHPNQRVEFSRWGNDNFGPTINIRAPLGVALQAGFDVSYRASLTYMDPDGDRVDDARIEEVTLRNSIGATLTDVDGRPRWYKAIRTIRRPEGLDTVPIRYTVERVIVDGANVVNVGQQRFDVEPGDVWPIDLLLYSVRLKPSDALFGFPIGESVILTHPSGSTTRIDAADGEYAAEGLARGLYRVQVADAPGWSPVTPIALSRDQEVRLRVITYLDIALVVLLGMGVALALLHFGRPHLALTAVAGARGVIGVARYPRSIGALFVRRRTTVRPATEVSQALATGLEFVLPRVRPELSKAAQREPHDMRPAVPSLSHGTVPIAQVIRATLGAPLPATRAEASALPPSQPGLIGVPHVDAHTQVSQPAPPVLATSMTVAGTPTVDAVEAAPVARAPIARGTGHRASASATGDSPTKRRRPGSREPGAEAKPQSRKGRRAKDAADRPETTGPAVGKKRRGSTKASPDASSGLEAVPQPRTTRPPRATASKKRSLAASAVTAQPKARGATKPAHSGASGKAESTSPAVKQPKAKAAAAQKVAAKVRTQPRKRPQIPETVDATSKRGRVTTDAAPARPSRPRSAPKAARGARPAKSRADANASSRSGVTGAVTPNEIDAQPSAGETLPAMSVPAGVRPRKKAAAKTLKPKRSAKTAANAPLLVATAEPDVPPPTAIPGEPSATPSPAMETTDAAAAAEESREANDPHADQVSAAPAATPEHRFSDNGHPLGGDQPEAESRGVNEASATALVGNLLRRVSMRAPHTKPRADLECTGCRAVLKPGARYCRRCGQPTAVGQLNGEKPS